MKDKSLSSRVDKYCKNKLAVMLYCTIPLSAGWCYSSFVQLGPGPSTVVQRLDNVIHWINYDPVDKC